MTTHGLLTSCPVCHVLWPGQCRNEDGEKVWPGHRLPSVEVSTR